jgi:hypothetical protein
MLLQEVALLLLQLVLLCDQHRQLGGIHSGGGSAGDQGLWHWLRHPYHLLCSGEEQQQYAFILQLL